MKTFSGTTEQAEAPYLDSAFWKEGTEIVGKVERSFSTVNGECYVLTLREAVDLEGFDDPQEEVSLGNLTGFRMAMQSAKVEKLLPGDYITLKCTGFKKSKKAGNSDRANFTIKVERDGF